MVQRLLNKRQTIIQMSIHKKYIYNKQQLNIC